jgi:hypothetical protein
MIAKRMNALIGVVRVNPDLKPSKIAAPNPTSVVDNLIPISATASSDLIAS